MTQKENNALDALEKLMEAIGGVHTDKGWVDSRDVYDTEYLAVLTALRALEGCVVIERGDLPEDLREVIERVEDSCQSYGARAYYMPEDIGALIQAAQMKGE